VTFEQYVLRMPKAAMMVVLDDNDRVLMMWRHRFIIDRWVWELPGGYVDPNEDPTVTAAREVEEETGWRPALAIERVRGGIDTRIKKLDAGEFDALLLARTGLERINLDHRVTRGPPDRLDRR
jgi:8-oxo-dGTP pyrophosphatase MutT (NUDIX family)